MTQAVPLAFFVLIFAGLLTVSIVLPLTVSGDPPKAASGFPLIDLENEFIEKVCPTQKDWTTQLATNERQLSNTYFNQEDNDIVEDPRGLNMLAIVWGQFLDHDVVLTINDPDTLQTIEFLNVTRTIKDPLTKESRTLLTPGIDGSTVYGDRANQDKLSYLKEPNSCYLKTSQIADGQGLPLDPASNGPNGAFLAGDERSDEHSILTAIHTLFVREHNRLCDELPSTWTAEERFWKARQIVIATIHHITYHEWFPALLGSQYNLLTTNQPTSVGTQTRIADTFAGAAFRFGHSMIPNQIGPFQLMQLFFNISRIQQQGVGYFLDIAADTAAQRCDLKVVNGLRNIMFGPPGEDLVTRNLFRARDMGLPTYPEICTCYGTQNTSAFEDPMLGLLNEPLVEGSSLPRTIAVVVAEQFNRLRESFDLGSAYEIRVANTRIGDVIRRNTLLTERITFFI